MRLFRCLTAAVFAAAVPVFAVYAPIPEQEQGKDLTVTVRGGVSYDSNLFGAADDAVDSTIFTLAPRAVYNVSLTDQTFFSGYYGVTADYFLDRPGKKLLDSHDLGLRLAHAFSKTTNIDLNESFMLSRNPESLLSGIPLNPDQSFSRNQLDGRFTTPLSPKIGTVIKARSVYFDYRNATLGRSLDRIENMYGVAGDYAVLPELKAAAEYRHQDIFYRKEGELKNKRSDYVMAGLDYDIAQKLTLSSRVGAEWRRRAAEEDSTGPFVEISGKYDYAPQSFLVSGYTFTFDETSDTARFTDTRVHRFFANLQHKVTALIVASGSFTYEPSELQGRRASALLPTGQADVEETTVRLGFALSYIPTKNWTLSATADYDRVWSGLDSREMIRRRAGLNAIYTF